MAAGVAAGFCSVGGSARLRSPAGPADRERLPGPALFTFTGFFSASSFLLRLPRRAASGSASVERCSGSGGHAGNGARTGGCGTFASTGLIGSRTARRQQHERDRPHDPMVHLARDARHRDHEARRPRRPHARRATRARAVARRGPRARARDRGQPRRSAAAHGRVSRAGRRAARHPGPRDRGRGRRGRRRRRAARASAIACSASSAAAATPSRSSATSARSRRSPTACRFEDAAAVPEAFITAHDAMVTQAALRGGETLLVHAVGSGVGTAAVQLGARARRVVIGTARTPDKLERAKRARPRRTASSPSGGKFADAVTRCAPDGARSCSSSSAAPTSPRICAASQTLGRIVLVGLLAGAQDRARSRARCCASASASSAPCCARGRSRRRSRRCARSRPQVVPLLARGVVQADHRPRDAARRRGAGARADGEQRGLRQDRAALLITEEREWIGASRSSLTIEARSSIPRAHAEACHVAP